MVDIGQPVKFKEFKLDGPGGETAGNFPGPGAIGKVVAIDNFKDGSEKLYTVRFGRRDIQVWEDEFEEV